MQVLTLSVLFSVGTAATTAEAQSSPKPPVHVKSYTTKKGEQVKAATRSSPNHTQRDNYSAKGNVNPFTGKTGSKKTTH
jgi:hypothetical protein